LGIVSVKAPGGYYTSFRLNPAVDIGGYATERSPDRPILLHMIRTPCQPGLSEHDQNRAGRAELLTTPFALFERNIREQLGRTLAGGGFDPAHDIAAITVNRWPHGYAPEFNPLWEPDLPSDQQPNVIGRARFGRISIANSDAGRAAYTDIAIDQAHRPVDELLVVARQTREPGRSQIKREPHACGRISDRGRCMDSRGAGGGHSVGLRAQIRDLGTVP
jgi:spermidine dehydrogenase